jgi:hypothetical protein
MSTLLNNFREKTQRAGLVRPTPSARASSRVSASPPRTFPSSDSRRDDDAKSRRRGV